MKDDWGAFVSADIVMEPYGEGRLSGKTFAVKDVFDIRGYTAGAGNPDWHKTHAPAESNAAVIDRLLLHGARLTGTTQTDELMYSLNGENYHYGTPVNPKAPERIPGGSSSGSAVAVSAGMVDFALGTDTGGSVRIPSAYCGVYGFRPTHGRLSVDGVIPLAPSFDTVGWMARDTATLLDAGLSLLGEQRPDSPRFRTVLFATDAWAIADSACREALRNCASALASGADRRKWIEIAGEGLTAWMKAFRIIQGLEIWKTHGDWIRRHRPKFGPDIADRFAWTATLQESESRSHFQLREDIRRRMAALLGDDGLLVIPTAPGIAPYRRMSGEETERRRTRTLQLSCIAGLAGLPQITLPWAEVAGCPVGLSVIAGPKQDAKLLAWANEMAKVRSP